MLNSFQLNEYDIRPLKRLKLSSEIINLKRKNHADDRPFKKIKLNEYMNQHINYSQYKRDILLYT